MAYFTDESQNILKKSSSKNCCFNFKNKQIQTAPKDGQYLELRAFDGMTANEEKKQRIDQLWNILRKSVMQMGAINKMKKFTTERHLENLEGRDQEIHKQTPFDKVEEVIYKWTIVPSESLFKTYWDVLAAILMIISFSLVPYTIVMGTQKILLTTLPLEFAIDIFFTIDIILNFFTAYTADIEVVQDKWRIFKSYLFSFLLFDAIATLPTLISVESETVYFLKICRFIRIGRFLTEFSAMSKQVTLRLHITKTTANTVEIFVKQLIVLFLITHILGCIWVYFGRISQDNWIELSISNGYSNIHPTDDMNIYIISIYWVVTTLTTVGYGDFKGYTTQEWTFQIIVEFIGIGFFAVIMGTINQFLENEAKLKSMVDDEEENLEIWLRKLDKSRIQTQLPKSLYENISRYIIISLKHDHNIILEGTTNQGEDFYSKLKPRHRYELIDELFGDFKEKFNLMFHDPEEYYYAEKGFIADFLANLYCRIFIPGQDIIKKGETFPELYLISKGTVTIYLDDNEESELMRLPTNSYFGEYQIIQDLFSTYLYKSSKGDETYCMCLSKKMYLELLKEYVNAKEHFTTIGEQRRLEIKRQKYIKLGLEYDDLTQYESGELVQERKQQMQEAYKRKAEQKSALLELEIDTLQSSVQGVKEALERNFERANEYIDGISKGEKLTPPLLNEMTSEVTKIQQRLDEINIQFNQERQDIKEQRTTSN